MFTFDPLGAYFSCIFNAALVFPSPSEMSQQLSALSICFGTGNIPSYPSWMWRFWKLWSSTTNWWMRAPCTQPTPNSSTLPNSHPPPLESPCRSVSLGSRNSLGSGNSLLLIPALKKKSQQEPKGAHEQSDVAFARNWDLCTRTEGFAWPLLKIPKDPFHNSFLAVGIGCCSSLVDILAVSHVNLQVKCSLLI